MYFVAVTLVSFLPLRTCDDVVIRVAQYVVKWYVVYTCAISVCIFYFSVCLFALTSFFDVSPRPFFFARKRNMFPDSPYLILQAPSVSPFGLVTNLIIQI